MSDISPPEAKSVSEGVREIPFGMATLDNGLGGLPSGTATLLAGASDAGGDAFLYTHAAQVMLAKHNPSMYPTSVRTSRETLPERVVYVTLSRDSEHILNAMDTVLDQFQFDTLTEHLKLLDYSESFLDLVETPAAFDREPPTEGPLAAVEGRATGVSSFGELLEEVAADIEEWGKDALVVVDSLNELYRAGQFGLSERTILGFLIGLREAAVDWDGLVHIPYKHKAEQVRSDSLLTNLMHGNLYFYSNDQGFETYRTMRVGSFGGALDREEQVVYRTQVGSAGFRVKATKKISPRNW